MTEPLLCLVCLTMLCWVWLLKSEVNHLRRENRLLREGMDKTTREFKRVVVATGGRRLKVD